MILPLFPQHNILSPVTPKTFTVCADTFPCIPPQLWNARYLAAAFTFTTTRLRICALPNTSLSAYCIFAGTNA